MIETKVVLPFDETSIDQMIVWLMQGHCILLAYGDPRDNHPGSASDEADQRIVARFNFSNEAARGYAITNVPYTKHIINGVEYSGRLLQPTETFGALCYAKKALKRDEEA